MMNVYINEEPVRVTVLDKLPDIGDTLPGTDEKVYSVEEVNAHIVEYSDDAIANGRVYLVRAEEEDGTRTEGYVLVPADMRMTAEEFVQNIMDNDEEGIDRMDEETAAEILRWTRNDDYKNLIPEDLTAAEFTRIWNEKKGV